MAIINCPECSKEISDTTKKCPHCGYSLKKKRKKMKKGIKIALITSVLVIFLGAGFFLTYEYYIIPHGIYVEAEALLNKNEFDKAIAKFESIKDYSDSENRILETWYKKGLAYCQKEDYENAVFAFKYAGNYNDAKEKLAESETERQKKEERLEYLKRLDTMETAYHLCNSPNTVISDDNKSITVDSTNEYDYISLEDIGVIATELGFPDYLISEMSQTNALMGRRSETIGHYKVDWSFHPDNGLDVVFMLVD
ncbi:MAG: zinc ribbon domain-containing protein [Ruminococcus sp.]|nr:zinc ribbon domain-containing protein [Ruminococcus sp.]